jgi:hypothetical protein
MRKLLILAVALVFLSGGSPLGLLEAVIHVVNYAAEPEAESTATEEFSSHSRPVKSRQRKTTISVRRFIQSSAQFVANTPFSASSAYHTRDLHTLNLVFQI